MADMMAKLAAAEAEAEKLRSELKESAAAPAEEPGLAEVRRRLESSGSSRALVDRVVAAVRRSGAEGAFAIDEAARIAGRIFRPCAPPRGTRATHVVCLVGPTGVGKTTTLAKLGLRLRESGRPLALATLDTYRVGAVDQLQTYADLLEVPLHVVPRGKGLGRVLERERPGGVVLVDTTGRPPRDTRSLAQLAAVLRKIPAAVQLHPYLVLAATTEAAAFDEATRAYALFGPTGLVLTKLDESPRPGAALERALLTRLGFAFLCDGQDVTAHLHPPHPDAFADLLLTGKIR